jgi:hypothetical protein
VADEGISSCGGDDERGVGHALFDDFSPNTRIFTKMPYLNAMKITQPETLVMTASGFGGIMRLHGGDKKYVSDSTSENKSEPFGRV